MKHTSTPADETTTATRLPNCYGYHLPSVMLHSHTIRLVLAQTHCRELCFAEILDIHFTWYCIHVTIETCLL